jgi:hypothetical protein
MALVVLARQVTRTPNPFLLINSGRKPLAVLSLSHTSGMSSRCLTSARRVFPWAAMMSFLFDLMIGTRVSFHKGIKRFTCADAAE